jgi:hypothetical protein
MSKANIKINDPERGTAFELMEEDGTLSTGDTHEIDDGVELTHEKMYLQKGAGGGEIVYFTLEFARNIGEGVAAAYIYDKLKDKNLGSLEIGGEEIEVDEDKIQKKLEEFVG